MHFHYFSLLHLVDHISQQHVGEVIQDCFSQNKQELVVEMESGSLRVGCQTPLTYIVPVANFSVARKNVVHLFDEIIGQRLVSVQAIDWERIMILSFENGIEMILKMHGAASNIMTREGSTIISLFRKDKSTDLEFIPEPGAYHPEALQSATLDADSSQMEIANSIREIAPVFDKQFALQVKPLLEAGMPLSEALQKVEASARLPVFFLKKEPTRIRFLLFPPTNMEDTVPFNGIAAALESFLSNHFQYASYRTQHRRISTEIGKPVKKYQKVYNSYKRNVDALETGRSPEEIGHLIMANLHAIPAGVTSIEVDDFYQEGKLKIKLKPDLNAQENAKRYYDKHKSIKGKLKYLKSQLSDIERKLYDAEVRVESFGEIPVPEALIFSGTGFDAKKLREWKKEMYAFEQPEKDAKAKRVPYRTFQLSDYEIFVGLNGKNNDRLTFKFASKEDIWLHAKDVAGSHVIIRKKAGQNLPQSVLEYAAGLAAYYSKLKNNALVPVSYTPRKYVRKRKGDPPGLVVVEREEVVMAEPVKE